MASKLLAKRMKYLKCTKNTYMNCFYRPMSNYASDITKFIEGHEVEEVKKKIPPKQRDQKNIFGEPDNSFESLLRRSKFCQIGPLSDRIVMGTVVEVVNNDLYIDFGGKFPCVCMRPKKMIKNEEGAVVDVFDESYTYGSKVKLYLKEFEMAAHFLGSERYMSLFEADAVLLGHMTIKEEMQQEEKKHVLY